MSRAPVRRGAKPRKGQSRGRAKKQSTLDRLMAMLPFSPATLQRIATWGIVGAVGLTVLSIAGWLGIPGMIGTGMSQAVGEAGLRVDNIEIHGQKRMDTMTIYAQVLDQSSRAMPLVDLAEVRERLLKYPWIEDARVSRRLPDKLVIDIVERKPGAIWQNHGQLMLIDPNGVPLEPVSRDAMPDLPLLIGEGANSQEPARRQLLDAAPALKPLIRAATWVGNRRWDLIFDTGEKLQLPEGEEAAAKALRKFAELDGAQRLLGRGKVRFDLRVGGNMVVQQPAAMGPAVATNISTGE